MRAIPPMMKCIALLSCLALATAPAMAQDLPPVPDSLMEVSGAVCVAVAGTGKVTDAYVLSSTGSEEADRDMLDWARKLLWPAARGSGQTRNKWLPVPIGFGEKPPPPVPANCPPPDRRP